MQLKDLKNLSPRNWHYDPQSKLPSTKKLSRISFDWSLVKNYANEILKNPTPYEVTFKPYENSSPLSKQLNDTYAKAGYKESSSQYYEVNTEKLHRMCLPILKQSILLKPEIRLFIQIPGQIIPMHIDAYESYSQRYQIKAEQIERHLLFVENWTWGHYLLIGNDCIHQWAAGDSYLIEPGIWHCSANCGVTPKLTINITGLRPDKIL